VPLSLKHTKVSDKADGQDDSLLQPSHWNAEHTFTVPAKKLVGNADDADGPARDISIGEGLELDETSHELRIGGDLFDSQVVVVAANPDFPNARALTDTATIAWDAPAAPNDDEIKGNVQDNSITLAKLDHGTEAQILYYGASGAPTRLAPGVKGSVLVTGRASAASPVVAFTAPSWGFTGAPHAVLRDKKGNGVDGGSFNSGDWRDRALNEELYDVYGFVTLSSNTFTLVAGTYVVEWSAPAFGVSKHQTRLYNKTNSIIIESGTPEDSGNVVTEAGGIQTRSTGIAHFVIPASKDLSIQHRCYITNATDGLGANANFSGHSEIYTIVKIWRLE